MVKEKASLCRKNRHREVNSYSFKNDLFLSLNEEVQRELYTYSHGISPVHAIAEEEAALERLHEDIPGSEGFTREVIHKIMGTAVVAPRFNDYDQAMMMAEQAVAEAMSSDQVDQSKMLTMQREINIYLNQS